MIYYAFFHSIINYGIIAWGGAYKNNINLLQNLQKRILKIVNKNNFVQNNPMNLEKLYAYESLLFHYVDLKTKYQNSSSKTRNKNIIIPKFKKKVSNKKCYLKAISVFNLLPNELKTLHIDKAWQKKKLKNWIITNY